MLRVKTGIIGCGVISNTYIRDLQRLYRDTVEICAVADFNLERAQKTAEQYGIGKVYTTETLLADPEIELAVNLTPPALHSKINRCVLEAGKHLFCEKPFALNVKDAQSVATLAEKMKRKIGCAPDSFMGSAQTTCHKLIQDGWIGKPLYACMNMMNCGVETWHPTPENFYREGGGPLYDMGGYYFTVLVELFGAVESVFAMSGTGFPYRKIYAGERFGQNFPVQTPTHYTAVIRMKNGMLVSANFSFDIWKTGMPMFEVYGTDGTMEVPDPNMHGGMPKVYRKEQSLAECFGGIDYGKGQLFSVPEFTQNVGSYVRGIGVADLAAAIREDREPRASCGRAIHVLEVLTGMMKSAEEGEVYRITTDQNGKFVKE